MSLRLPLFPLGLVLFPGELLPLHIFEPRYRQLLADCLAGEPRFGLLQPGIGREAPAVSAVGCIAGIRGTQGMPDGRANIVVQGERRFLVTRYLEEGTPYLLAMVEPFDDRAEEPPDPLAVAAVAEEFRRYDAARRELHELPVDTSPLPADPGELSFHVAAAAMLDLAEKQRLLESRSARERIGRLLELLPALRLDAEAGLAVHRRARTNGKGHRHPDELEAS